MPNTTHISYKDKGFWIPESFIEVLSQYVCETFESIGLDNFSSALLEIYDDCHFNRNGSNVEMVNNGLDNINDLADKVTFIDVLEKTKKFILSNGFELSVSTLNEFESKKLARSFMSNWTLPIKTQSLVATIDIIEKMLNETWESSNYGVYYAGFPKPDSAIEI
ncbi:MAG TPA: hypothetical protein VFE53_13530 [Mucilaginibacter sp.]|jgi:hypothetical protein|nr:hypothetical protein [Mucilaginibacter sp.]